MAQPKIHDRGLTKNSQYFVLLRRGWTIRRLWIISVIGITGLGLDVAFHTLDTSALSIVFDGANWNGREFVSDQPPAVLALSWTGHLTFLTAFSMLIVMPRIFFYRGFKEVEPSGRMWVALKPGRTIWRMWLIALIGAVGMSLDLAFHWIQDGGPEQVLLNGFFTNTFPVNALAISAHVLFMIAFTMLIFLPKILFARYTTTMPTIAK
jgi:hypothetical protein